MTTFYLPDLGEGLPDAEILEWYIKVGDHVETDQALLSMETAKAVVDVPSPKTGKIKKLFGSVNDVIKTGSPLVEFEGNNDDIMESKPSVASAVGEIKIGDEIIERQHQEVGQTIKAMPAARIKAKKLNIDLSVIIPSHANGIITVEDIEMACQSNSLKTSEGKTEPLRGARRAMLQSMVKSHAEVVPVLLCDDVDVSHFNKTTDITVRLIQAIIYGLKQSPALNVHFYQDKMERVIFDKIHLAIAMDFGDGLFTPVIHDAEQYDADGLRSWINSSKEAVRNRTIKTEQMQGATFTLSNFGNHAGKYGTPIIIPPTVSILGIGRIDKGSLPLSLSFDHRVVTGSEAAIFLAHVQKKLG